MSDSLVIFLSVFATSVYFSIGIGVAKMEAKIKGSGIDFFFVLFWFVLCVIYSFAEDE